MTNREISQAELDKWKSKDRPWYVKTEPDVPADSRELLENYSKIRTDQVVPHVQDIRDKAWDIFPFPCIGTYRFLDLAIRKDPHYAELVERLKQPGATFLDLGCALGQDIRRLVHDGVPSSQTWGVDLQKGFIELGYDLFLDRDTLQTTFFAADVFDDDTSGPFKQVEGKIDVVQAAAFYHLFDWEQQKVICRRIISLLKPQAGVTVFGQQAGNVNPGRHANRNNPDRFTYRHDGASWKKLWDEVGAETGTGWDVEVLIRDIPEASKFLIPTNDPSWDGANWLLFRVTRLA